MNLSGAASSMFDAEGLAILESSKNYILNNNVRDMLNSRMIKVKNMEVKDFAETLNFLSKNKEVIAQDPDMIEKTESFFYKLER